MLQTVEVTNGFKNRTHFGDLGVWEALVEDGERAFNTRLTRTLFQYLAEYLVLSNVLPDSASGLPPLLKVLKTSDVQIRSSLTHLNVDKNQAFQIPFIFSLFYPIFLRLSTLFLAFSMR